MSGNARSILHLLDVRGNMDVQLETRYMAELMFEKYKLWCPIIAEWYEKKRWQRATLAP